MAEECDSTERTITLPPQTVRTAIGEAYATIESWIFDQIAKEMAAQNIKCNGQCPEGEECGLELLTIIKGTVDPGIDKDGERCETLNFPGGAYKYKCVCAENDRPKDGGGGHKADDGPHHGGHETTPSTTPCDPTERTITVGPKTIRAADGEEAVEAIHVWILEQIVKDMKAKKIKCDGTCAQGEECGLEVVTRLHNLVGYRPGRDKNGKKCVIATLLAGSYLTYKCVCAKTKLP